MYHYRVNITLKPTVGHPNTLCHVRSCSWRVALQGMQPLQQSMFPRTQQTGAGLRVLATQALSTNILFSLPGGLVGGLRSSSCSCFVEPNNIEIKLLT